MLVALTLLLPAGQAQLWATPHATVAQPILAAFSGEGDIWHQGDVRLELDRVGQRVIGIYVTAPQAQTEAVARGILAAWGAPETAVPDLQKLLDDPGFQKQVSGQLFEELDQSGGSAVHVRLRGGQWEVYTAIKVHDTAAFPPVTSALGNETAQARIDIASDYQCPYCNQLWQGEALAEWRRKPGVYRLNYHHFPLGMHPLALPAAQYAECAAEQGRFWEFSDEINADFDRWMGQPDAEARQSFMAYAVSAGAKQPEMEACLDKVNTQAIMGTMTILQGQFGVNSTPSVFVNGIRVGNYADAAQIRAIRAVTEAGPGAGNVIAKRLETMR